MAVSGELGTVPYALVDDVESTDEPEEEPEQIGGHRIVERIGQPFIGVVTQMQRLEAAVRPGKPDRQENQGLVDPRPACRMTVADLVREGGMHGDGDREDRHRQQPMPWP